MSGLLRPPAHRGPLIAAGAVLLTVAVGIVDTRFSEEWSAFALFALNGAFAAAFLYLGLQARPEGGAPPAYQSTLLVAGLALSLAALMRLAEVLGSDADPGAGTLTWVALAFGALALWPGVRKRSAICTAIAAIAFGAALLFAWQWIFEPDTVTPFRWLLLVIALAYVAVSLVLRGSSHRHSELLVSAAGLAILAIALLDAIGFFLPFGGERLSALWEGVMLVAGFGLLAYAAADRVPGPAFMGVAVLFAFTILTMGEEATLMGWPLALGALGAVALAAGLRPTRPLPPEPDAIGARDLPLAARTREEETVIRVRDES